MLNSRTRSFKEAQKAYMYDGGRWGADELDKLLAIIDNFADPNYCPTSENTGIMRSSKSIIMEGFKYILMSELLPILSRFERHVSPDYSVYSDCLAHRRMNNNLDRRFIFNVKLPCPLNLPPINMTLLSEEEKEVVRNAKEYYGDSVKNWEIFE